MTTYVLVVVSDLRALLLHQVLESLPAEASIPGSVHSAIGRLDEDDLVVLSTPQHVVHLAIKLECLEVD